MRLDVFCLLLIGYFINVSNAAGKAKDATNNVQVAEPIQKHSHQHSIYKENEHDESDGAKGGRIIIHNHESNPDDGYARKQEHAYNPEKKNKTKYKKAGKKKSKKQKKKKYGDDQDFKKILENYDTKPEKDDGAEDGGYKTSVRTEHYEVKKINPNARYPDEKYIIEGAYKVQETDPWGFPTTSFHQYDSPISKIAASILSKYDYTNFRPGESDDYHKEKEEERDHDNIEYDGNDDDSNLDSYEDFDKKKKSQGYTNPSHDGKSRHSDDGHGYSVSFDDRGGQKKYQPYTHAAPKTAQDYRYGAGKVDNNGKDYEKSGGYGQYISEKKPHYPAPIIHVSIQPSHENLQSKQPEGGNKNQKPVGYNVLVVPKVDNRRAGYLTRPVDVEYIAPHDHDSVERDIEYEFAKEFGHLIEPGHSAESSDDHHDYDSEYQKHLIDYIYGNNGASNKYVHKDYNSRRG